MTEYQIVQLIGKYQQRRREHRMLRWREDAVRELNTVIDDLRAIIGMEDHQVVVWMAGANPPHYEIKGTGLVYDGPRRTPK